MESKEIFDLGTFWCEGREFKVEVNYGSLEEMIVILGP